MATKPLWTAKDLVAGGLSPSLPFDKIPLWADGSNVVFQQGGVRPFASQVQLAAKLSTARPLGAMEMSLSGTRALFWGTAKKLYRFLDGTGSAVDVTRTSGGDYDTDATSPAWTAAPDSTINQEATLWSFAQWGDASCFATNGGSRIQVYDAPSGKFRDIASAAAAPDRAEILFRWRQFLLAFNTSNGSHVVDWADADNPEGTGAWTPSTTNTAGELEIFDLNSPIVAVVELGDAIGIYGTDQLKALVAVDPPFYFAQQHLLTGIGAVGKHSVVNVGRLHYGISHRGIFRTDGTQIQWIDTPQISDYIFLNVNMRQLSKALAWHSPSEQVVRFFWPEAGENNNTRGVEFNYGNDSWTILGYGRAAATPGSVFFFPIALTNEGDVLQEQVDDQAPTVGSSPMVLGAAATLTVGYDQGGYDQGGYDGTLFTGG